MLEEYVDECFERNEWFDKTWVYSNFEEWKNQVINPFITSPSLT